MPQFCVVALLAATVPGACRATSVGASRAVESAAPVEPGNTAIPDICAALPDLAGTRIRCMRRTGDECWWGADGGLAVRRAGCWTVWTSDEGLPHSRVQAIDQDSSTGDVWLGTWGGGLARLTAGRFDAFTQFNSGLAGDLVFDVLCAEGRIWAATNGGVSAFDPRRDEWTLYFARRGDRCDGMVHQLAPMEGGICAKTWEGVVHWKAKGAEAWNRVADDKDEGCRSALEARHALGERAVALAAGEPPGMEESNNARQTAPRGAAVAIGVIGPFSRTMPLPKGVASEETALRTDLVAVQRAAQDANARRAGQGLPPIAVLAGGERYRRYGWTLPEDELAALVLHSEVAGIIGAVGAPGLVLTAAVETTEVPVVNVVPPGGRPDGEKRRWTFRCRGDEPRHARMVLDHLVEQWNVTRFALIRTGGDEESLVMAWWRDHAARRGLLPVVEVVWDERAEPAAMLRDRLASTGVQALLSWGDTPATVKLIEGLRRGGWDGLIVAGSRVDTESLKARLGGQVGQVLVMAPERPAPADPNSALSMNAAEHLIAAMEQAGGDRGAVRRVLDTMQSSSLGEMHFEREHRCRPLLLGEWQLGQWRWIRLGE